MSETPTGDGDWPQREDTLGGPSLPPAPAAPPPPAIPPEFVPPRPDSRPGPGAVLAVALLLLLAAGAAIAYFVTRDNSTKGSVTTVVVQSRTVVTTTGVAATVTHPKAVTTEKSQTTATTTQSTTTGATTTAPTTTTPVTTAPAPPPANATVPDVGGSTEQAAATQFGDANVLASIVFVPSSDTLGTVEGQAKPPGTTVPYHSHVQVNVAAGPHHTTDEPVPNTVGQSLTQAVATLNGAHLRLIYVKLAVTSRSQAGKVVQQSPLAGAKAPENAQVLVFLGAFRGR